MAERSAPIGALSSLRAIPCFRFTEIEGEPFCGRNSYNSAGRSLRDPSIFSDQLPTRITVPISPTESWDLQPKNFVSSSSIPHNWHHAASCGFLPQPSSPPFRVEEGQPQIHSGRQQPDSLARS